MTSSHLAYSGDAYSTTEVILQKIDDVIIVEQRLDQQG
jgi:hypothetical protein